jgi:hypothetical protein
VLDAEFLDEPGREHARRKRATENRAKLLVKTTNTHILKLEIRRDDGIRRRLLRTRLDPNLRIRLFHERHVRLLHHDARVRAGGSVVGAGHTATALFHGELEHADALDHAAQVLSVILEYEDLSDGEYHAAEPAYERGAHIVCGKLHPDVEVPL